MLRISLLALALAVPVAAADRPPNVVLIVADDLGWNDVSFHGSEIRTPVLDRLAREGVRLERFYTYPTCSPTRACLLSGRNAARFGIPGPIGIDGGKLHLPLATTTLAELLKERGYATGLVGKWHLGAANAVGPRRQGFDSFYGYLHGQVDQFTHLSWDGDPIWLRGEDDVREEGHATDLFAREAASFIGKHRAKPFFLALCFSVPHYPVQAPPEWLAKYRAITDPDRRGFAAMVSHMDDAIGRVLQALDAARLGDNTLILFTSDNGGQKDWLFTRYGGKHGPYRRLGDNRPLRGWKGELYEGGVRVVALARWPGVLKPGSFMGVAHACDVFPTVAGRTGGPAPAKLRLDGLDLWPALTGKAEPPPRSFHWNVGAHVGILDGDYKLIRRVRGLGAVELFNLTTDPLEKQDLAAREPAIAARLQASLDAELRRDKEK